MSNHYSPDLLKVFPKHLLDALVYISSQDCEEILNTPEDVFDEMIRACESNKFVLDSVEELLIETLWQIKSDDFVMRVALSANLFKNAAIFAEETLRNRMHPIAYSALFALIQRKSQ